MKIMNKLEETIVALLQKEPYYGYFTQDMVRIFTDKIPSPAGVMYKNNKFYLYINPEFFEKFPLEERMEILKHECAHVHNRHIFRYATMNKTKTKEDKTYTLNHQGANVAMDLAINNPFHALKNSKVIQGCFQENFKKDYPDMKMNETFEYYYDFFLEKGMDKDQGQTIDDHSLWEEGDQVEEHVANEIVKQKMEKAVKSCKGIGNVPGDVLIELEKLNKNQIPWKRMLRIFSQKLKTYTKIKTRKKVNKRYGILFPGKKREDQVNLIVGIDTSGSVGDTELQVVGGELDKLVDAGCHLTVIEADYEIQRMYEYKKGQKFSVKGRGGTAYQPILDKVAELKADGLVYFGDGDVFEDLEKPKYPVLWAMFSGCKQPADFGYYCEVNVNG